MGRSVGFKASFDKTYNKLESEDKGKVDEAIEALLDSLEFQTIPKGLGLKRLQDGQWEIRVGIHLRVCFRMKRNLIEFGIVGSHETIKNFLKNL